MDFKFDLRISTPDFHMALMDNNIQKDIHKGFK